MRKKERTPEIEEARAKRKGRNDLIGDILRNLVLIGLGALPVFCPDFTSDAVSFVLGWVLIIVGAISLLACLMSWPVMGIRQLVVSIALVIFGVFILLKPYSLGTIFGIIVGIYLILHGISSIIDGAKLKKIGKKFTFSLILGLVMIALGVVLLFVPLAASKLAMLLVGIALMVCGVVGLLLRAWIARKVSKSQIIDAE